MDDRSKFSFAAVLLAAGHSSRMSRPKMLLPWGQTTILGHLISSWTQLGAAQIAVVCQPTDAKLHAELDRLNFPVAQRIPNPDPDRGMFSSVQCASTWRGWQAGLTHWAIVLGDQPQLSVATLSAVRGFAAAHPRHICQPSRARRPKHPVFMSGEPFSALAGAGEPTLKDFLAARSADVKLIELNDPVLDLDIDRPEDYEEALKLFLKS